MGATTGAIFASSGEIFSRRRRSHKTTPIPFAAVGAIIAAIGIALTRSENRGRAKAGLVLNGIVIVVAILRLGLFGGLA